MITPNTRAASAHELHFASAMKEHYAQIVAALPDIYWIRHTLNYYTRILKTKLVITIEKEDLCQ